MHVLKELKLNLVGVVVVVRTMMVVRVIGWFVACPGTTQTQACRGVSGGVSGGEGDGDFASAGLGCRMS